MKKWLTLLLALALVLSLLPAVPQNARAADTSGSCGADLTWAFDASTGALTFTGTGEMSAFGWFNPPWVDFASQIKSVAIPSGVTVISSFAFVNCTALTSVTVPASVTYVGDYAFSGCTALTSVNLAKGLTAIGECCFSDCSALTAITLPASLDTVGGGAFMNCNKLAEIQLASGNPYFTVMGNVLFDADQTTLVCCPGTVTGGYTVPDTVTSIGNGAFAGCSGITAVTLPASLINISSLAFRDCIRLTKITIPDKVTRLALDAFEGCKLLTSISVNSGNSTYASASGVVLNKKKDAIYYCPMGKAGSYTVPATVKTIYFGAFSGCTRLTAVTITDGVTEICGNAFSGCTGLKEISLPESVDVLDKDAFSGCTNLADITVLNARCKINDLQSTGQTLGLPGKTVVHGYSGSTAQSYAQTYGYTFRAIGEYISPTGQCGDNLLWTLDGDTLSITGSGPMYTYTAAADVPWDGYRDEIRAVTIESGATDLCAYAFDKCTALLEAALPDTITAIHDYAFNGCTALAELHLPSALVTIGAHAFDTCTALSRADFPDTVRSIDSYAYCACSNLTEIILPEGVTTLGSSVFTVCSNLAAVSVPASLQTIGTGVFSGCSSLNQLKLAEGLNTIGTAMFAGCSMLTSVELPKSLTTIGANAFNSCGLTMVAVPASVTSIGNWAFRCAELGDIALLNDHTTIADSVLTHDDGVNADVSYTLGYPGTTTIHGNAPSNAQSYAVKHHFEFVALEHEAVTDPAIAASCTESGLTEGTHCWICGEILTAQEEVPALGHDWDAGTVTVEPTADSKGVRVHACSRCDATKSETIPPILAIRTASISLKNDLSINFYVSGEVLEGWENPYMLFTKNIYNETGDVVSQVEMEVSSFQTAGEYRIYSFPNISAKEISSEVSATLCATRDGELVHGKTCVYSVRQYAEYHLNNSSDNNLRRTLVKLLDYGAAAQNYWDYNLPHPANKAITAEQRALVAADEVVYLNQMKVIPNPNATVKIKNCTLSLDNRVEIIYRLSLTNYTGSLSDLKLVVTYDGKKVTIDDFAPTAETGIYRVVLDTLTATQMRTVCSAQILSKATGEVLSQTVEYSIGSYAFQLKDAAQSELKILVDEMMLYGDNANVYFSNR